MVAQPQHFSSNDSVVIRMNATVQDLLNLPDDGYRYEMIKGVIVRMPPPQHNHGAIGALVIELLGAWCRTHGIRGRLTTEVGYRLLSDDTVLAPDVSIAQIQPKLDETYATVAPLLAVEIASPSQSRAFLQDKAKAFITAGTQMVWVLWQDTKTIDVYIASGDVSLSLSDTIDGGSVLPGFTCLVIELFP
jgi:Uma2 family endonuclease